MLDLICVKHYGSNGLNEVISAVLEANPGLADAGPVYDSGRVIFLPDIVLTPAPDDEVTLWD
ncbi:hypothetical protein GTGU_00187 [Trabulsiella guamensis ATCC 49490]|uniref:Phage tail protein n=1 Tax=Trabulsiella guamensis ATCC 49490 TaxID=1005994 RepID=A0A085ARU3_9ENTR|nr:hypothetical protein GTGU_00187 [Trabulsiella guamensis ATCC 49490]